MHVYVCMYVSLCWSDHVIWQIIKISEMYNLRCIKDIKPQTLTLRTVDCKIPSHNFSKFYDESRHYETGYTCSFKYLFYPSPPRWSVYYEGSFRFWSLLSTWRHKLCLKKMCNKVHLGTVCQTSFFSLFEEVPFSCLIKT